MANDTLSNDELSRLRTAGVTYPWSVRQTLRLLGELERLRCALEEIAQHEGTYSHDIAMEALDAD